MVEEWLVGSRQLRLRILKLPLQIADTCDLQHWGFLRLDRAFVQRQKVVLPDTICVGLQEFAAGSAGADHNPGRRGGEGRLNDWMGGERTYCVREEVVGLGQYGRTLTVLTCHGLSAEKESEYDDEEQELIESWTPKFRRWLFVSVVVFVGRWPISSITFEGICDTGKRSRKRKSSASVWATSSSAGKDGGLGV
jgi:hypothetical protein